MALKVSKNIRINPNKEEMIKEIKEEKIAVITFHLPQSLKDELQITAIRSRESMGRILIKLIKEFLNNRKKTE